MEKKRGQGIKSISHVSRNGTAKKKCALVADGSSVAQEGDVSPDCAILRGFLAKEEEKSDWHPLEHKDGKRECRPHQNEKSKVLAMKNPTRDAPKATANITASQAAPAQLSPPPQPHSGLVLLGHRGPRPSQHHTQHTMLQHRGQKKALPHTSLFGTVQNGSRSIEGQKKKNSNGHFSCYW